MTAALTRLGVCLALLALATSIVLAAPGAPLCPAWLCDWPGNGFGHSSRTGEPVVDAIAAWAPVSLALACAHIAMLMVFAFAAMWLGERLPPALHDAGKAVARLARSVPVYAAAIALATAVAEISDALPSVYLPTSDIALASLVLPALSIALLHWANISAAHRSIARSTGTPARRIALRVLAATLTQAGPLIGAQLIVEVIYGVPGLGRLLLLSLRFQDFALVHWLVLPLAALTALAHCLARHLQRGEVQPGAG